MLKRIFNCVPCTARFSVVDGYYPTTSVNHPFVPALKAVAAVAGAYEFYQIGLPKNGIVSRLPICRPAVFKPTIGWCCYKMDCRIGFPESKNNFGHPDIYTTSHAGDKNDKPIIYCLEDCRLQAFFIYTSDLCSFSGRCPVKQQR